MLSFQKDLEKADATQVSAPAGTGDTGITGQNDYLTVSSHGKKLRQSTLALVVLFAVGAVGVWFMIKKTVPATANAAPSQDQLQLEAALAQLNTMQADMDNEMDSVVGRFHQFGQIDQVGVDELKKNPFQREAGGSDDTTDPATLASNELQYLREQAQARAQQLDLWSITTTPKGPCCMIDDKLLYEGDTIGGMVIRTIQKKSVLLDYNGISIQLKMSE